MDKKFMLKFAGKNLAAHKLRTALTVSATTIGVSAIVFLVSFAFGLERLVTQEITGGDAFELVDIGAGNSQIIKINEEILTKIAAFGEVVAAEPNANVAAVEKIFSRPEPAELSLSFTTDQYINWSGYQLKAGEKLGTNQGKDRLVVNEAFLERVGQADSNRTIGKATALDVFIPKEMSGAEESKIYEDQPFTIIGVVKGGSDPTAFAGIENFTHFEIQNFSQIKARVTPRERVGLVRQKIENMGFRTEYLGETVTQVEQVFKFFKLILGSFGLIALVVASLGMFNTLTISLLERTKEIALLKIIGMKRREVKKIFITESTTMGAVGGVLGVTVGLVAAKIANSIFDQYATRAGGDTAAIFAYPLWFLFSMVAFAILVGLLTGIYPAQRAARINALDVLRHE